MRVELDRVTADKVRFAARVMGVDPAVVIARLVEQWTHEDETPTRPADEPRPVGTPGAVPIYKVYKGTRVEGELDLATGSVTITDGPLRGRRYTSPSLAAMAVVGALNPTRENVQTNGWRFWRTVDGGSIDRLR